MDTMASSPSLPPYLLLGEAWKMAMTTLPYFQGGKFERSHLPSHFPSGYGMRMTMAMLLHFVMKRGGRVHGSLPTPLLPQRSMGEIAVAFPPSFWTTLPYFPRGHGRNHNGLPTLLLNMV